MENKHLKVLGIIAIILESFAFGMLSGIILALIL